MEELTAEDKAALLARHAEAETTRAGMLARLGLIPSFTVESATTDRGTPRAYVGPFGGSEPEPLARRAGDLLRDAPDPGLDEALRTALLFQRAGSNGTSRALLALACLQGGQTEAGLSLAASLPPRSVEITNGLPEALRSVAAPFDVAARFVGEGRRDEGRVLDMLDEAQGSVIAAEPTLHDADKPQKPHGYWGIVHRAAGEKRGTSVEDAQTFAKYVRDRRECVQKWWPLADVHTIEAGVVMVGSIKKGDTNADRR